MTAPQANTVYLTRRRRCYHTDRDCLGLSSSRNVREKPLAEVGDDIPICGRCSESFTPHSDHDPFKRVRMLEDLDPDEISSEDN